MSGRSRTEVTFNATVLAALSCPCVAQGFHNGHGDSQNQPPSVSPMIAAVPLAARAAVKKKNKKNKKK
jgi:hypothetical protein